MMIDCIYLQVKDETGEPNEEITWCQDEINDTDITYIRLDKILEICESWKQQAITQQGEQIADAIAKELHQYR